MVSLKFPDMFNNTGVSINRLSDYEATLQNLKLLLWSEKGELFGDPYYGTSLKRYLFDQNDVVLQDILIDDLYTAIALFMPQLKLDRKDITLKRDSKGSLELSIKAINREDFTLNTYNLVLLEAEV